MTLMLTQLGFTLLELLIVIAIIGTLASIAIPAYSQFISDARMAVAESDLHNISLRLQSYFSEFNSYPDTLQQAGITLTDPWGHAYQYIPIQDRALTGKNKVQPRMDKFQHPLNTDFDIWSMGPDGVSQLPLTAKASRDDIIRANNGSYLGLAENY